MGEDNKGIFGEIARVEGRADEILAEARDRAAAARQGAEREIAGMVRETARQVEEKKSQLNREYEARTSRSLAGAEAEFKAETDALDRIREEDLASLVDWTAERLQELLAKSDANGH